MSIDKDKIKHTAKLARISLDEKKIDDLSKDLSNIFKFIEKLNEAKTENVKPLSSILDHSLRSREDKVDAGNIRDQILKNAPNKNKDFFIVPKVIE
jgi:aspartyl-tRNA(Asn)/glutamyl-tRNA(Gln) amidotransferase subunit C